MIIAVIDVVDTAIHGDAVAMNKRISRYPAGTKKNIPRLESLPSHFRHICINRELLQMVASFETFKDL
jgi:hypothetical protein